MLIENTILDYLKTYKKGTISLSQLENLLPGKESYDNFTSIIRGLEDKKILKPVKSHGTNGKSIPLHNTYRIIKSNLRATI
ncbi:MAG: cytosolic protein, partial [Tissierellia bacterium]|nr:cytosolic protein [Tissierellia bacterium]